MASEHGSIQRKDFFDSEEAYHEASDNYHNDFNVTAIVLDFSSSCAIVLNDDHRINSFYRKELNISYTSLSICQNRFCVRIVN